MQKLVALVLLVFCVQPSKAQLLNKIKEKAAKAADAVNKGLSPKSDDKSTASSEKTAPRANWRDSLFCKLVYELPAGETFCYDETDVLYENNTVIPTFVLRNSSGQYFLVKDNQKTGPFKDAPIVSKKRSNEDNNSSSAQNLDDVKIGSDDRDPVAIKYSKTIGGKLFLVFNGKNYGPFDYVSKMVVHPDGKRFFAVVTIGGENPMATKMGMGNNFIINEGSLKQKIGDTNTIPNKFGVSDGFRHAMVLAMAQIKEEQRVVVTTSTGKKTDAPIMDLYGQGGLLKITDNGDILSVLAQSPTQLMLNGVEVGNFSVPLKSKDRLMIPLDVKKAVYYDKGKLYRADGTASDFKNVLFPKMINTANSSTIYYYKMQKNETGGYEVFLCKKSL